MAPAISNWQEVFDCECDSDLSSRSMEYRCTMNSSARSTSHSSVTSNIGHFLIATPMHQLPASLRTSSSSPKITGAFLHSTLIVKKDEEERQSGKTQSPSETTEFGLSADGEREPPSPRLELSAYRAGNSHIAAARYTAPMDRFLAGNDEMVVPANDQVAEKEWRKLRTLRANALRLRSQVKEQRAKLQIHQKLKNDADVAFMNYVMDHRPSLLIIPRETASTLDERLESLFNTLQDVRNTYGPVEDDYNALENELDETEFQLARMESLLYNTRMPKFMQFPDQETEQPPGKQTPTDEISLLGLSSDDGFGDYHPLEAEYLSRLGDLDLAKERHHNLLQENEKVLWAKESRARIGLDLDEYGKAFLKEFPAREAAFRGEITQVEEEVERSKERCLEAGLDISEGGNEEAENSKKEEGEPSNHEQHNARFSQYTKPVESSPSMFTLLLPQSATAKARLHVYISEFDESKKDDRFRRWMLHKLRTSALEVNLLMRVFLDVLQFNEIQQWKAGTKDWQFCVLVFWDKDEDGKAEKKVEASLTRKAEHTVMSSGMVFSQQLAFPTPLKKTRSTTTLVRGIRNHGHSNPRMTRTIRG